MELDKHINKMDVKNPTHLIIIGGGLLLIALVAEYLLILGVIVSVVAGGIWYMNKQKEVKQ